MTKINTCLFNHIIKCRFLLYLVKLKIKIFFKKKNNFFCIAINPTFYAPWLSLYPFIKATAMTIEQLNVNFVPGQRSRRDCRGAMWSY